LLLDEHCVQSSSTLTLIAIWCNGRMKANNLS